MLAPRNVVKWQEWWYPVHGLGAGFEFATRDLAAQTIRRDGRLELRLLATAQFPQAECVLARNDRTLLRKKLDLTPNEPAVVLLTEDYSERPVQVTVTSKDGRVLARYTSPLPIPKVEPPDPAKFVEKPDDQLSVEELFLKGRKADRGTERRNARRYYEKACARDPGHIDSLLRRGRARLRGGIACRRRSSGSRRPSIATAIVAWRGTTKAFATCDWETFVTRWSAATTPPAARARSRSATIWSAARRSARATGPVRRPRLAKPWPPTAAIGRPWTISYWPCMRRAKRNWRRSDCRRTRRPWCRGQSFPCSIKGRKSSSRPRRGRSSATMSLKCSKRALPLRNAGCSARRKRLCRPASKRTVVGTKLYAVVLPGVVCLTARPTGGCSPIPAASGPDAQGPRVRVAA